MSRSWQLTMYALDPDAMAAFWSEALGYIVQPPPDGFEDWPTALRAFGFGEEELDSASAIVDPNGTGPRIFLHRVPERKADQRNRLHLDVRVTAGPEADAVERAEQQDTERVRLQRFGATFVEAVEEHGSRWLVMTDPEGNEFCIT